jgi:transcriptional regulator with XRE-family HTH domain
MTKDKISSFGEYLRALREKAALPLRKVAADLDIDPSLLAKIERDERKPTKNVIRLISKIFNQDEHKLLIEFLSDQIAYQVMDEEDGIEALKVAEKKVKYFKKSKGKQANKKSEK